MQVVTCVGSIVMCTLRCVYNQHKTCAPRRYAVRVSCQPPEANPSPASDISNIKELTSAPRWAPAGPNSTWVQLPWPDLPTDLASMSNLATGDLNERVRYVGSVNGAGLVWPNLVDDFDGYPGMRSWCVP